jgi:hypothetical protein
MWKPKRGDKKCLKKRLIDYEKWAFMGLALGGHDISSSDMDF